jgi:hypothetical protein
LAVNVGAVATPCVVLVAVTVVCPPVNVPLAPLVGAANVTTAPLTRLLNASFTVTCSAANAVPTATLCGVPAVAVTPVTEPAWFVNAKLAVTPFTVAVTEYEPAVLLAVNVGAVATPCVVLVAVTVVSPPVNVPLAPLVGAVNVTTAPLTGLLPASVIVACSGVAKPVLMVAVCPAPVVAVMLAAAPVRFVKENVVETPFTAAPTTYCPTLLLAVNVGAVATPWALLVAVAVVCPPVNVPLAPLVGAVNVTTAPLTGLLLASVTVACSGVAKLALIAALCPVPASSAMLAGAPA